MLTQERSVMQQAADRAADAASAVSATAHAKLCGSAEAATIAQNEAWAGQAVEEEAVRLFAANGGEAAFLDPVPYWVANDLGMDVPMSPGQMGSATVMQLQEELTKANAALSHANVTRDPVMIAAAQVHIEALQAALVRLQRAGISRTPLVPSASARNLREEQFVDVVAPTFDGAAYQARLAAEQHQKK